MVRVMVKLTRLYGIHEVTILEGEHKHCTAALITTRPNMRIYNGLILDATIVRKEGLFIDMVVTT
ncbi:asb131 [Agrotis segetum nucleopolyhedrovirus B]|uniref:Asb131 n=1 Tax=Agrotis segetum nucleopolyhedrovirus B TaxID=1580580 RepID=A0A0A7KRD8_9ABAC|nr:asb131 [Agrotis segetum nucleopolyhedrovirus B]AIZ48688.1 asb131 [Agrotis segetum nucleopolyhedrovirus B]